MSKRERKSERVRERGIKKMNGLNTVKLLVFSTTD